jgi:hypothetical protein
LSRLRKRTTVVEGKNLLATDPTTRCVSQGRIVH